MLKTPDQLKILLLQIRDGEQVRREEHQSFAEYCGVELDQLDILNVFDTPEFSVTVADNYDALLVGGASEANVLKPDLYPFCRAMPAIAKALCGYWKNRYLPPVLAFSWQYWHWAARFSIKM